LTPLEPLPTLASLRRAVTKMLRAAVAFAMLVLATRAEAAPPGALLGKSVVITWEENRIQRNEGELRFYSIKASYELAIYVSEKGRVFARAARSTRAGSGATERVDGKGDDPAPTHVPKFGDHTLQYFMPLGGGGRLITAQFDAGFGSCAASARIGRSDGSQLIRAYSPITKRWVEIQSVEMSGGACAIQAGNVMAR
jgi:hypothetical protein